MRNDMNSDMKNVTCIMKAFKRPAKCEKAIKYVLRAGIDNILLGFDGDQRQLRIHRKMIRQFGDKVKLFVYPYNTGLSAVRNRLLAHVGTKYFLMLDDDNYVPKEIKYAVDYLESFDDVMVVGFSIMHNNTTIKSWTFNMEVRDEYVELQKINLENNIDYTILCDKYHFISHVDTVENCAIFRTKAAKEIKWDEKFIIGGEHEDFYLRRKYDHPHWKVALAVNIFAIHEPGDDNVFVDYKATRYGKERNVSREHFKKKWNVTNIVGIGRNIFYDNPNLIEGLTIYTPDYSKKVKGFEKEKER